MLLQKRHNNEFASQVKRDIVNSIWLNKYKYLLTVVLFLLFCAFFEMNYASIANSGYVSNEASFGDIILFIFHGMKVYIPAPGIKFEIPVTWLSCQIFVTYIIGNYIRQDMTTYGQQYIIRSTHKSYWFIGKMLYCVICVLLFYCVGYMTVFGYSLIARNPSFVLNFDVCAYVSETNIEILNQIDVVLGIVILPIITSIVLSVGQTTLSIWIKPIYSIIIIVAYVCASTYYFSYLLIGNYSMILRSKKIIAANSFITSEGIHPIYAIVIDCCLIIVMYSIALIKLKKYDYIEKS